MFAWFQLLNIIHPVLSMSLQEYPIPVSITVFMAYWAHLLVHMCFRAHQTGSHDGRFAPCVIGKSGLEEGYLSVVVSDAGKSHKMKCSVFCVWNHTHFHNI